MLRASMQVRLKTFRNPVNSTFHERGDMIVLLKGVLPGINPLIVFTPLCWSSLLELNKKRLNKLLSETLIQNV
jgi:hypothetical protein